MFIIGTEKITVAYGDKVILENVSFSVNQGEKMSIVGVNGAGKSTLMRLLYDKSVPYTGNVFLAKGKTVGHLEQQIRLDGDKTVWETALDVFRSLREMELRMEEWTETLKADHSEEAIARFTALQARFEKEGGYEYRSRARGTLIRMGFDEEKQTLPVAALSGGQRTILQLALLLLEEPDILLLDEPTNHLDLKALSWLEEELKRIRSTVLLISHDRLFLDRVTQKTLEIENTHAKVYHVGYSQYREEKKKEREIQEKHYKNQQKEIARIEAFIAQQKRWNREKNIVAAESRQKALDRMVKVEKVSSLPDALNFHFADTLESGNDVLSVQALTKGYDKTPLFDKLSFEVKKKDRLVILGANGSGKSTLLQILAGNLSQDDGSYRYGYNVKMGYYDQYQRLNEDNTVLEEIWEDDGMTHTQVRSLLATFLFKGDDVFKEIRVLSGGERARLVLAKLMQKKVNLLLLDEPTNHLDIESREALEEAILSFGGTVIAVSHDRYFIHKIATRLLHFQGDGEVSYFPFGYDSFCEKERVSYDNAKEEKKLSPASDGEKRFSRSKEERRKKARIRKLEEEIEKAETTVKEIEAKCAQAASDYVTLEALYQEKATWEDKCNRLLEEWASLEE